MSAGRACVILNILRRAALRLIPDTPVKVKQR